MIGNKFMAMKRGGVATGWILHKMELVKEGSLTNRVVPINFGAAFFSSSILYYKTLYIPLKRYTNGYDLTLFHTRPVNTNLYARHSYRTAVCKTL